MRQEQRDGQLVRHDRDRRRPAGEKAAVQAAWFGKRVAMVDQAATPRWSAVRTAGVPTMALRETASYLTGFRQRDTYGLSLQLLPALALERLLARTAQVIATRTQAVRTNLDRHGVQLLRGQARLGPGPRCSCGQAADPSRRCGPA